MKRDGMIAADESQGMVGRAAGPHVVLGMDLEEGALAAPL
jgi:hypothetical protein